MSICCFVYSSKIFPLFPLSFYRNQERCRFGDCRSLSFLSISLLLLILSRLQNRKKERKEDFNPPSLSLSVCLSLLPPSLSLFFSRCNIEESRDWTHRCASPCRCHPRLGAALDYKGGGHLFLLEEDRERGKIPNAFCSRRMSSGCLVAPSVLISSTSSSFCFHASSPLFFFILFYFFIFSFIFFPFLFYFFPFVRYSSSVARHTVFIFLLSFLFSLMTLN